MARKLNAFERQMIQLSKESGDPVRAIMTEYQFRLRANDDEATVVLVGHLCIENLLDKIIQVKCKSPKTILDDSRSYTFAVKLQIIYSMGLLPDDTYKNIIRINKFRNKFAHNIEFIVDPNIMLADIGGETFSYLKSMPENKKKKNVSKKYLDLLCFLTLEQLSKYMIDMGVEPQPISD